MCKIYASSDPILYESRTRSVRIHGVVTTLRLENMFWQVIQEIANNEHMTTSQFIEKLYDELAEERGEITNFSSFLRVCCLIYMQTVKPFQNEGTSQRAIGGVIADRGASASVLPLR
jgi:predicted DNA-binding ribbon-helix-helix protein